MTGVGMAAAEVKAMLETAPEGVGPETAGREGVVCRRCEDSGMVVELMASAAVPAVGERSRRPMQQARPCECRIERVARQRLERAGVPRRYAEATLKGFRTAGVDPSIAFAAGIARTMVEGFPMTLARPGLLLAGTCGVGKTHLAAALLRALVLERGATGRFYDLGELLVQLKRGFGSSAEGGERPALSEGALFDTVAGTEVLVLDDLGRERATDWSYDEVNLVLAARYNANRLTVVTTNFPNAGPGAGKRGAGETLGDRIGARTWSRLQEMCRPIEMLGADFRMGRAG